jgi:hypothetical protein
MAGKLEDLKGQLQITEALNKALEHQLSLQKQLSAGVSKQSKLMQDMGKAASSGSGTDLRLADQRSLTKEILNTKQKSADMTNELQRGMKKAAAATGGFKGVLGGIGKFMMSWKGMALGIFGGLVAGITKVFSGLLGAIKGIFSLITTTIKVSMGVIKSLIMAPFKLSGTFSKLANDMKAINVVINTARQSVNGMIGDHQTLGDVTTGAYASAKKAVETLPGGMFGPHEDGAAQKIQLIGELTAAFGHYQKQLKDLGPIGQKFVVQMSKNLGFTGENIQKVVSVSKAYGKNLDEEFKTISLGIVATAKAGGLNVKTLGKDFSVFFAKLGPATGMASHKIVAMAAAFAKMGISADSAMGMFTKFDTLEGGAEVVSKMSRSLGIHVSQTQMIMAREKGPLEQLRIVQESMRSAGKSFEDLSYDGKKMITEMFGGDQAAAMKAFGAAGMESSDSIEKAAKAAKNAKDARDMPKLMQKLNKSIQKIADSFGKIMAPFEAFTHGLTRGGKDNKFVKNMMDISRAFGSIGREVGKILKESGFLEKMTTSLKTFAVSIKKMMPLVKELVDALFSDQPKTKRSPYEIVKEIGSKLLGSYGEFYSNMSKFMLKAAAKIVPVLIQILAWVGKSINSMLTSLMDGTFGAKAGSMFDNLGASIKFDNEGVQKEAETAIAAVKKSWNKEMGPKQRSFFEKDAMGNMKKVTKKAGVGGALIETIIVALTKSVQKIGSVFGDILGAAFSSLWKNHGNKIMAGAALWIFGPMVIKGAIVMIGAKVAAMAAAAAAAAGTTVAAAAGAALAGAAAIALPVIALLTAGAAIVYAIDIGDAREIGKALDHHNKITDKSLKALNTKVSLVRTLIADSGEKMATGRDILQKAALGNIKLNDLERDSIEKVTFALEKKHAELKKADRVISAGAFKSRDLSDLAAGDPTQSTNIAINNLLSQGTKGWHKSKTGSDDSGSARRDVVLKMLRKAGVNSTSTHADVNLMGDKDLKALFMKQFGMEKGSKGQASFSAWNSGRLGRKNQKKRKEGIFRMFKELRDESIAAEAAANDALKKTAAKEFDKTLTNMSNAELEAYMKHTGTSGPHAKQMKAIIAKRKSAEFEDLVAAEMFEFERSNHKKQAAFESLHQEAEAKVKDYISKRASGQSTGGILKGTLGAQASGVQGMTMVMDPDSGMMVPKFDDDGGSVASAIGLGKPDTKKLMRKVSQAGSKVKGVKVKSSKKAKALGRLPPRVLDLLASRRASKRMFAAGLEMTEIMDKLGPAAQTVSDALHSAAIPALQGTATAAQEATSSLATTVVMLAYVRDKLAEVQAAYSGILESVVEVRKEGEKLKGKHSAKITTETGKLEVNIHVNVDSKQIAQALEKTPVVTWSGAMGAQGSGE